MLPLLVWELVYQTINCIHNNVGYFTLENWIVVWTNVRGGNLMWARMSGVVIRCEHECPVWSFDVSTNVRPCQKSRGNECPWERMSVHLLVRSIQGFFKVRSTGRAETQYTKILLSHTQTPLFNLKRSNFHQETQQMWQKSKITFNLFARSLR